MNTAAIFSESWLTRREHADHSARAALPTQAAGAWLAARCQAREARLVDLGSGSGANVRYLVPRLPGPQTWRLIDHDADLLGHAVGRCQPLRDMDGTPIRLTTQQHDLNALAADWLTGADLVTASALCDLVSDTWVASLAAACARHRCAALIALSVDGDTRFCVDDTDVTDRDDAWLFTTLAAHQRRDKGFGPALGTAAPQALATAFADRGFRLVDAPSPWRLGPAQRPLALGLLDGWAGAAREQAPEERPRIDRWWRRRREALDQGRVDLYVGHRDIFAAPEPDHGPR